MANGNANANADIVAEILAEMRDSQAPSPLSPIKSPEKRTLGFRRRHTFLTTRSQTPKNRGLQLAEEQNCFPGNKTCQKPKIANRLKSICRQKLLSSVSNTSHGPSVVRPDEQFTVAYNKICQKAEQDLLQLLIRQQQKNSSTDAETISSLKQQLSRNNRNVPRSVKERESRKENTVSHKPITDQNKSQPEKTRGKP